MDILSFLNSFLILALHKKLIIEGELINYKIKKKSQKVWQISLVNHL